MRILATVILAAAVPAAAARITAPGYSVHSIPTPDVVQGGAVSARGARFVGQGMPGGASEYVIRLGRRLPGACRFRRHGRVLSCA